jgi:zinc/manganese transport system substrate-binding protein
MHGEPAPSTTSARFRRTLLAVTSLAALALAPRASAALKVVTTTEGLAALAREAGGDKVEVQSLSRGIQDPHFVDPNPMLAVKLRQADLLVDVGLDLEAGWLPSLVNQARNGDIQPNGSRRLTAARFVHVVDVPGGAVDRSMGDLHPAGNPHFIGDPRAAVAVTNGIAEKLAQLDAGNAPYYRMRGADFGRRVEEDVARWRAVLAPLQGRPVVAHHQTLGYLLAWTGLRAVAYLEPKPGVPPPPSHLAEVVRIVKADGVKAILIENYYDPKSAELVARHTGAKVVVIPGDVGGAKVAATYPEYVELLVKLVAEAVR